MEIADLFKDFGPIGGVVAVVWIFIKDRRAANDRLYTVLDETRVLLVEVRELIKHHIRDHADS